MDNKEKVTFYLLFQEKFYQRGSILRTSDKDIVLKVAEKPKRKWYQVLLQYITFGIYKARWNYKVTLMKEIYD